MRCKNYDMPIFAVLVALLLAAPLASTRCS